MADQDDIWGGCPRPREVLASDEVDLDPSLDLWDAHGGLERGQSGGIARDLTVSRWAD